MYELRESYGNKIGSFGTIDESGEIIAIQSLIDHLMNTAKYAAEIGKGIDCYYLSFLVGIAHDVGKCKVAFRERILGLNNKSVNHSSAGAIYLRHKIENVKFWNEIEKQGLREADYDAKFFSMSLLLIMDYMTQLVKVKIFQETLLVELRIEWSQKKIE